MPKLSAAQAQLLAENTALRAKLETAEQTLRELLSGEADALFVTGADGPQIFSLKGDDQAYRTLIEDMSEGALTLTAAGVILYANRRFAEMLKIPLEKVIGASIHTCVASKSRHKLQSLLGKDSREKRRDQLELVASDGARLAVNLSLSNLPVNGMPDAFCMVATDLSEQQRGAAMQASEKSAREMLGTSNQSRQILLSLLEDQKQVEAQMRKLNEELEGKVRVRTAALEKTNLEIGRKEEEIRSVVDHMLDCVITIDDKGIIHSANPVVEEIFGYTHDEVIGKNVSMLMPEPDHSAHDSYRNSYLRTGEARIIGIGREVVGKNKNGKLIPLELSISEYFVQGDRYFTGILRDIRERVRIMDDLQQAKHAAELASHAKSEFLAAMSHEIRTPMNGVIGMVDVLQQSSLTGSQIEMSHIIHDSAFALLSILDDILDFSKIEAGKLQIENVPMSVADVVESACDAMNHIALRKDVELTLFTDPGIPAQVLGDPGRLRQILVNLTNNAIKFSSGQARQGKVSVRTLLAESTAEQVKLELRVRDNGIGMDEATQARLFTPFSQANTSTTRTYGGTGLGLAISQQLAHIMGGDIAVQSEPDKGTVFIVHLAFQRLPEPPEITPNLVAGLHCLVAGGSDGLAEDIAVYLEHAGALVERQAELSTVQDWIASRPPGMCIVVVDTAATALPLDQLRAVARAHPEQQTHFVEVRRGQRRVPRLEDADLVLVDGNMLSRRVLLKAVAVAAGKIEVPDWQAPSGVVRAVLTPLSREEARRQGRLILIAEDNEINQKVVLQQLRLLGQTADIASDGRVALNSWQSGDYSLLLTDLHMPEMDGYELTAAIRDAETVGAIDITTSHSTRLSKDDSQVAGYHESPVHNSRMPIIAFTANAIKGEAEHCREIGMDDYLSKPVQLVNLKAMLEKWLPVASEQQTAGAQRAVPILFVPVDTNVLKALVGDDEETLRDFLHDFRISAAKIAVELRAACAAENAEAAGALAHKLKSSARSVGALALGELCAEIEKSGKLGNSAALAMLMLGFEQELAKVERFLAEY